MVHAESLLGARNHRLLARDYCEFLLSGLGALRELNAEVGAALEGPTPQPTPLMRAVVLPSGHTPPTAPGGAQPNESEIPESLRPFVESLPVVGLPTPGPEQARSLVIPALWTSSAPVVQGDGWEQLKKGVAQHLGTADPGDSGNMVFSAHNDIFGELFPVPPEMKLEYVVATIDVKDQKLKLFSNKIQIEEFVYSLR